MIVALALAAAAAAPTEKLDALVSRIAKAYGGEKALGRVKAYRETGTLESPRGTARTLRVFAPPERLRVEIAYAGGNSEVRVLDGPRAWRDGEAVAGVLRDSMVLQAARLDLPGLLLRYRKTLVDLGEMQREGATFRGIGVPLGGRLNVAVQVDPKTARILHSEGALPGPGGGIRFATDYSDFRRVAGVLFAFHEVSFASGQKTGDTQLEKVELLQAVPEGAFKP